MAILILFLTLLLSREIISLNSSRMKSMRTSTSTMYTATLFNVWTVENAKDLSKGFVTESSRLFGRFKNKQSRQEDISRFLSSMNLLSREFLHNSFESPFGQRGEWWTALQIAIVSALIYGSFPLLGVIMKMIGCISMLTGVYYSSYGLLDIRESVSPFIYPVSKNILKTQGSYSFVRHPIYSGLILASFGLSLITGSLNRFLLSIGLAALLDIKASQEEILLDQLYPMSYLQYARSKNKFLPYFY